MQRQMHLCPYVWSGPVDELCGWRHPVAETRYFDPTYFEEIGRKLENAKIDAAFMADSLTFINDVHIARGGSMYLLDPLYLAMCMLRATKRLGVGVTASSTFYEPYGLARSMGTINCLSGGRFGWNVVTGGRIEEAEAFGTEPLDRAARYERATEVVEACIELWESFPAEAVVLDKQSGEFIDLEKMRSFDYEGKYVGTKGPLNVPASPQGRPVIMQAGASESGRQFAARFGEVLFFLSRSLDGMQTFYETCTVGSRRPNAPPRTARSSSVRL